MARRFQSGDSALFPVPAVLNGTDGGPRAILAITKINTSAYQALLYTASSGADGWWIEVDTSGGLHLNYGTGSTPRNVGTVSTGSWVKLTARKDNGGTFQPIGRHGTGAGFATDSGDITAASTLVDGTAIDTSYGIQIGRWGKTGSFYSGDHEDAFYAVWNTIPSGATLAAIATKADAIAAGCDYWISFEGSTAVDSLGNTATLTGTTVTSDPTGFFATASGVTPSGLAISLDLGAPAVALGLSASPAGLAVALNLGAPSTAIPSAPPAGLALGLALGIPATAIPSVSPAGLAVTLQLGAPVVAVDRSAVPAGLAIPITLGNPQVSAGVTLSGLAVALQLGTLSAAIPAVAPAGLALGLALGAPAAAHGRSATPAGLALGLALGAPQAGDGPAPVDYRTALLVPSATSQATLSPAAQVGATLAPSAAATAILTADSL